MKIKYKTAYYFHRRSRKLHNLRRMNEVFSCKLYKACFIPSSITQWKHLKFFHFEYNSTEFYYLCLNLNLVPFHTPFQFEQFQMYQFIFLVSRNIQFLQQQKNSHENSTTTHIWSGIWKMKANKKSWLSFHSNQSNFIVQLKLTAGECNVMQTYDWPSCLLEIYYH